MFYDFRQSAEKWTVANADDLSSLDNESQDLVVIYKLPVNQQVYSIYFFAV
jgi:hypothetical protein